MIKYSDKIDILSPAWFQFKPEFIHNKFSISVLNLIAQILQNTDLKLNFLNFFFLINLIFK